MPDHQRKPLEAKLRQLVGSFNWLSQATRPDLTTITSILARYQNRPSPGHIGGQGSQKKSREHKSASSHDYELCLMFSPHLSTI